MSLYTDFTDIDALTPNRQVKEVPQAQDKVVCNNVNQAQIDALEAKILLTIRDYDNKATLLKGYIERTKAILGGNK